MAADQSLGNYRKPTRRDEFPNEVLQATQRQQAGRSLVCHGGQGAADTRFQAQHRHQRGRFIFTNYLSKVSTAWKAKIGEGTAVNWPSGAGGKGYEGVSAFVNRLPNSIGYVEFSYVKQNKMNCAQLQNASGKTVAYK